MKRTPLRRQSTKQGQRHAALMAEKRRQIQCALEVADAIWCSRCGRSFSSLATAMDGLEFHHIVYRSLGGGDDPDNLVPLCWECHREQHDKGRSGKLLPRKV